MLVSWGCMRLTWSSLPKKTACTFCGVNTARWSAYFSDKVKCGKGADTCLLGQQSKSACVCGICKCSCVFSLFSCIACIESCLFEKVCPFRVLSQWHSYTGPQSEFASGILSVTLIIHRVNFVALVVIIVFAVI